MGEEVARSVMAVTLSNKCVGVDLLIHVTVHAHVHAQMPHKHMSMSCIFGMEFAIVDDSLISVGILGRHPNLCKIYVHIVHEIFYTICTCVN